MKTLFLLCLMFLSASAFSADVYFAQSAAGSGNGSSCSNAEAVSTFNAGSATAGNTYHLCGTVTSQVATPACTSGSSVSKCALLFDATSSGKIATAAISATGGVNLGSNPYWIIDGGTACGTTPGQSMSSWQTSCSSAMTAGGTGQIQSTNNGSAGTYANQIASIGVYCGGSNHDIEIRNLSIGPLYIKNIDNDNSAGASDSYGVQCIAGSNVLIHDITSVWSRGNFYVSVQSGNNTQIYNNVALHNTWGILAAEGSTTSIYTNLIVHNNDVTIGSDWMDTDGNYHNDGIFSFGQGITGYINGAYLYNNYLHGGAFVHSQCPTGFMYVNQNFQNLYVFNNVFNITAGYACNGVLATGYSTASQTIANNTFVGYTAASCYSSTGGNVCVAIGDAGANNASSTTIYNNVVSATNSNVNLNHSGAASVVAIDYNAYNGWDTHGQGPWNNGTEYDTLATWQAVTCGSGLCDIHNVAAAPNISSTTFAPNSGSPLIGAGKNLFSTCNGQPSPGLGDLCKDAAGISRPNSAWDVGAFQFGGAASAPSCDHSSGTYAGTQSVACSNPNTGTTVMCYTTNGTTPVTAGNGTSCTTGTAYTTAISVAAPETLKIIAGTNVTSDSSVTSYTYTIISVSPTCSPGAANASSPVTETCSNTNSGTTVMCGSATTTPVTAGDGVNCTTGTVVNNTFVVSTTATFKIVAGTSTLADSSATSYSVNITPPNGVTGMSQGVIFSNGVIIK